MQIQGKIWGHTSPIFTNNNVEIHRMVGVLGGFCSKHSHQHKYNMFHVEQGRLKIQVWKNDYDLVDTTIIGPGEQCIVAPGEFHQFHVLEEGTVAYEIYWTQIDASDIHRESCGGTAI